MTVQALEKSLSEDGRSLVLKASGCLNIETASELHRMVLVALCESKDVLLDVHQVEEMDITTLQILCAACKTAALQKRSFSRCDDLPECLHKLVMESGVIRNGICKHNSDQFCIWFGGTT
jgi:anti-anti-sigma regulatory factor